MYAAITSNSHYTPALVPFPPVESSPSLRESFIAHAFAIQLLYNLRFDSPHVFAYIRANTRGNSQCSIYTTTKFFAAHADDGNIEIASYIYHI